jgi:hypothetical protein
MAATKKITVITDTALTVYVVIRRNADGYFLDDTDGSFQASPADIDLPLSEDATVKGLYTVSESRAVWSDGDYTVIPFAQNGGSPATATDCPLGVGTLPIKNDIEVDLYSMNNNLSGNLVGVSGIRAKIEAAKKEIEAQLASGLGEIRPAILDLQQSLLRGRK